MTESDKPISEEFTGRRHKSPWSAALFSLLFFVGGGAAQASRAENATIPGEIAVPYPTITNLSLEWEIQGDDNLNGVVAVQYRRKGEKEWHQGMPLRRIPGGKSANARPTFVWVNKHAGSLFDLKPGAEYEIRLKLADQGAPFAICREVVSSIDHLGH
ncbi:MAG: fibronectin type III domain-containing protein, partial [Acidobacteria bacterium]|nr:fibronectin type III domain-containing protein [Acidobacteriota bacterium]